MRQAESTASARYLGDLIAILDQERATRDVIELVKLEIALSTLRDRASRGGASERTVDLIQAVQIVLAFRAMPLGAGVLH
ncbi:hypothetical protein MKK70_18510 [Methylobacterium sp. E-041]|jgi:hypothetical protein|uniref:hypothetical protein n=1 Tax=unclassified Methylobacterium TaxID=2615210 RepID=UPI001FB9F513|nr:MULTISPECIES: hypothetical protein [unclassified Methylobacterium]MCJ2107340.1 hypothetical protein [Methylobacterium sp. E-041]MCJ2109647.1 hypothetical protein [Methylobacterium sp. E-025]